MKMKYNNKKNHYKKNMQKCYTKAHIIKNDKI